MNNTNLSAVEFSLDQLDTICLKRLDEKMGPMGQLCIMLAIAALKALESRLIEEKEGEE